MSVLQFAVVCIILQFKFEIRYYYNNHNTGGDIC